ncbi:hypothetical protein FXO38_18440 [Capsicum annuum]|nr:hypothetical protein FXO38_18440 [Capsicum annuum]
MVCFRLGLIALDNALIWDRAILVSSLLVGCEIDIVALIMLEIHECVFGETTTLPFPCLIQHLCDVAGMTAISEVDRRIKLLSTTDIIMMKDQANPVFAQRAQPPPIMILIHFEGPSALPKNIDRPNIGGVEMGDKDLT